MLIAYIVTEENYMKCPYCAKEMSCGYIYNGRNPVSWIPRESRMPIFGFLKPSNCVNLYHTIQVHGADTVQKHFIVIRAML